MTNKQKLILRLPGFHVEKRYRVFSLYRNRDQKLIAIFGFLTGAARVALLIAGMCLGNALKEIVNRMRHRS